MDLVARSGIETHHFNWTGWRVIGELLAELGCDLSEMSGSNDGDEVSAACASEWGLALRSALARNDLVEVLVEDHSFAGGWRSHLRPRAIAAARPVLAVKVDASMETFALRVLLEEAHLHQEMYESLRQVAAGLVPADCKIGEVDASTTAWVAAAATFFIESGGFSQY